MKTVLTFSAAIPAALAALALLSSPVGAQPAASAPTTAAPASDYTPTRAEVERDLAAWKESGLEAQWAGEESPNMYSATYVNDYKKYESSVRPASMSQPASQTPTGSQRRW
ncbi:DUF4148 domain-containing protein [Achromobacter sp.]|uniref:DUF4148 domain-containing protein n=1 Tax=Achromobacter sp. TaxID=134375 RepID=UPI0028B0939F|nr:DUF4148 domain-containing protein [Achromobacter sp.]